MEVQNNFDKVHVLDRKVSLATYKGKELPRYLESEHVGDYLSRIALAETRRLDITKTIYHDDVHQTEVQRLTENYFSLSEKGQVTEVGRLDYLGLNYASEGITITSYFKKVLNMLLA